MDILSLSVIYHQLQTLKVSNCQKSNYPKVVSISSSLKIND